jgi:ABC-type antimicrobial peptide transport system permease subunit
MGLGIGLAASLATNRLLQRDLWGTAPTDPMTMAAAILLMLTVGAVACLVPAWRAISVDPMVALRQP